jgi:hypothetical protein
MILYSSLPGKIIIMVDTFLIIIKKMMVYLPLCFILFFPEAEFAGNVSNDNNLFSIKFDASVSHGKIVLIIPGMGQNDSFAGYHLIGKYYGKRDIIPVYVNINWKVVGLHNVSITASRIYSMLNETFPNSEVYLFGFSFGAAIACELSKSLHADHILLCSMSPLFKEDHTYQIFPFKQLQWIIALGSGHLLSYSGNRGERITFLYGEHDSFLINSAIIRYRRSSFAYSETIIVKNARHNISEREYLAAIENVVQRMGR